MTRSCVAIASVVLVAAIAAPPVDSQQRVTQSDISTATAVLVDVVVRDKKGRPVTDLSAPDFDLAEDGVRQKVDSFTRVTHGGGIGVGVAWKSARSTVAVTPADAPPAATDNTTVDDATTALVFDHLSAESLRLAQRATLDYVPRTGESGMRVGVFATEPGVRLVQRFTTDRALVRKAVEHLAPSGTSAKEQNTERTDELVARRRELLAENESASALAAGGNGAALSQGGSATGVREMELRMVQTELNMLRSFDSFERAHQGYDTSLALLSIVRLLAEYPGRKTIVFFSEGLPVSPVLSTKLDRIIDVANRANVTAYVVDAKGLRTKSDLTNTKKELDVFGEERMIQTASGTNRTEQPLGMAFERIEDTLKLDARTGLARLAEDTGGFLVEGSNDLTSAFRRIDEDNQFHYLLTYSPTNGRFDGKFRAIQVKVRRPDTHVFARKGYRALNRSRSADAGGYEVPAIALLNRTPLPNAFPVHAAGFSFPDPSHPGLTPTIVRVGTGSLQFDVDHQRLTYAAQAAIVVRIRDGNGHEVQTISQQYVLTGEAKDLEAAKKGEILFYREPDLAPGIYTLESIVFDAVARQGSARVATLTVAAPEAAIGMSSLVLVNRTEEVDVVPPPVDGAPAPLYVGRTLLYPNLGEPINKSATGELPFYFTLYGNVKSAKVYAQLLRNGQAFAEAPLPLVDSAGPRVQHVGRLPVANLASGTYELRIRVVDGTREISRAAFFTVQE